MTTECMDGELFAVVQEARQSDDKQNWFYKLLDTYYQQCVMHIGSTLDVPDDEIPEDDWPINEEVLLDVALRPSGIETAIQALFSFGNDINGSGGHFNALMLAVGYADYYMTRYLLDHGADPHIWPDTGDPPEWIEQNYYLESLDIAYMNWRFEGGNDESGFIDAVVHTAELLASQGGLRDFEGICLKVDHQGSVSFSGPHYRF